MTILLKSQRPAKEQQQQHQVDQPEKSTKTPQLPARHVAVVRTSDLAIGAELGRGGFCSVREVYDSRIPLRRLSKRCPQNKNDSKNPLDNKSDKKKSMFTRIRKKIQKMKHREHKSPPLKSTPIEDDTECPLNGTSYVVKLLRPDLTKRALSRGRLDLCIEAAHLLSIKHSNIVRVVAISRGVAKYLARDSRWKEETEFFIVMERLEITLEDMIRQWAVEAKDSRIKRESGVFGAKMSKKKKRKEKKERWLRKLEVAKDVAGAVKFLHENGVVYRDLKPSNIGFSFDGTTTLFDFGLAKTLSPKDKICNSMYKMTGHTGSLRYMAPEVALDLPYNNSVDSYSFAMLMWQICSYMPPFMGFTREKHDEHVIRGGWRPPIGRKWPQGCVDIIERCWSDNISKRMDFTEIEQVLDLEINRIRASSSSKW